MTTEPIISVKDLKKSYGSKEVLKGVSLDVYPGQLIGYIGPNGAGKSTTIKTFLGIIEDYEGEIKIFGEDISSNNKEYKRRIGYVPEVGEIYDNLTAKEYLTFIGELYGLDYELADKRASKLVEIFGIQSNYNNRISSFSKGMRQKVMIISSLLHDPDILFLDEPLSGLDANSVIVMKEILSQLIKEGKTIFYSSHIMDVVEKISNRIIVINNGEVVADGSFEELKRQSEEGSLERIFNDLTGFNSQEQLAKDFIATLKEV
ncbi:ABC transporter ATP-binding protein [uncultured Clostridium sp.]|uniref:ABC transporter ATP-binding protein n=1 Tax=uncultured Clostridium sp. TaxID=59620 RepID=UPI0025835C53|nr:ABC transporter ATP-binding protein [uncultured Clostridium sp.]MDU1348406.1 ABC transporter ATP-binding protein [Clostridium argentinense]